MTKKSTSASTPTRELIPLTATIRQADLVAAINRVAAGASTKDIYSFLNCLWFVGREFKTTNLELWLSTTVDAFLTCDEGFAIGIPLRKLLAAVKSFSVTDGILTLSERVSADSLQNKNPRKLFSITGPTGATLTLDAYNITEMPALTMTLDWENVLTASVDTFAAATRKAFTSISKDSVRPVTQSLCIEPRYQHIRMVATDSYRLVRVEIPANCTGTKKKNSRDYVAYLVPRAAAQLITKVTNPSSGNLVMSVGTELERDGHNPKWNDSPTFATFTLDDLTITTRLTVGEYPKYNQLIPETVAGEITFSSLRLIQAINRAKVVLAPSAPFVVHVAGKWSESPAVSVMANESGVGSLEEPIHADVRLTGHEAEVDTSAPSNRLLKQYVGADTDDFAVGYNTIFLADGIKFCGSRVVLGMSSNLKPTVMRDPNSADVYVLMPIRISKDYGKIK